MSEIPEALVTVFGARDAEFIAAEWPAYADELARDCARLEDLPQAERNRARAALRSKFREPIDSRFTSPPDWRGLIVASPDAEWADPEAVKTRIASVLRNLGTGPARTPPAPPAGSRPAVPKSPAEAGGAVLPPRNGKTASGRVRSRTLTVDEIKALDAWDVAPAADRQRHIEAVETELRHADPHAPLDAEIVKRAACARWLSEGWVRSAERIVGAGVAV